MSRPVYTLIAGINGAGKTSLYWTLNRKGELGVRINIDEIAKDRGNWKDNRVQIAAGRQALAMIGDCIDKRISFHLETTLPGLSILRQIKRAKENGFEIQLYFVGVESVDVALDRVHRRMAHGGHGIDDACLLRRYEQLIPNLRKILPYCDRAVMFDNTVRFRQIALIYQSRVVDCDRDLPGWFIEIMDELKLEGAL